MKEIEELFSNRLLRKIPFDQKKVIKSLKHSQEFLNQAKKLEKIMIPKVILFLSYTSMFHAARALAYKEGIQEKSHIALFKYIKLAFSKEFGKLIYEFNNARELRHEGLYGLESVFNKEDSEHSIKVAKEFLERTKQLLKIK